MMPACIVLNVENIISKSIVGPRPLVDKNFELYPIHVKATINNVKPGLTGIGSIVFRDEERLLSEQGRIGALVPETPFLLY